jgi:DNA-binding transcriptional LysR family regulator
MLLMLNLARIRVFFEVVRHRSFSRAADQLDYTPSAVSHQISALERELATRLINRSSRPWSLTDAGARLFKRVESALNELAAAEVELAALHTSRAGRVRLSSVASGLRSVVPPATAAFNAEHPDVELHLSEAQPADILRRLHTGAIDIGIIVTVAGQSLPRSRRLSIAKLLEQSLMIAVPSGSRLASAPHLTLRQLREQSWLLPSRSRVPEFRQEIDELFEKAGYQPKVALELDDEVAGGALVAAGMGIGLIPGLAAPAPYPQVTTVPLRPQRLRTLHAVTTVAPHGAPVQILLDELRRAASQLPARARGS